MTRLGALLGLLTATSTSACADLKEMMSLQQGLAQEFHTPAINLNLNTSRTLTVVFANSPYADLQSGEQSAFARRVAEYVRDHYAGYARLQRITVGFATVRGGGGMQFSTSRLPYTFTPQDLGAPRPESKPTKPVKAAA